MSIKNSLWGFAGFVAIGWAGGVAEAQRIACVDIQRALEESVEGKAALKILKDDAAQRQKVLSFKQDIARKLRDELKGKGLTDAERKAKQEKLSKRVAELQEDFQRAQRELKEREVESTKP